jgi:two-component system, chemotaxis family, chemotaxis protein CheY
MSGTDGYDMSGLKGLVVDDSFFMQRVMEQLLRALGVGDVRTAEDGLDAYERYCSYQPDFVITDWDMENHDGPSFVKRVRTDPQSPNPFVPVIMLTGYAEHSRVLQARDFGITEFMVKPISADGVYKRLVSLIENPRPFVNSGNGYFGPCRRRLTLSTFEGENRRMAKPEEVSTGGLRI